MASFLFEGKVIEAEDGDTVLSALLSHGISIPNGCRAGACQACLLRSEDKVAHAAQVGIDELLAERGAFLSCQAKASDVKTVSTLGEDLRPSYPATLVGKAWLTDDVLLVDLHVPNWNSSPGRFIRIRHESGVERPFSLAAPAWKEPELVQLHIRVLPSGEMSQLLKEQPLGTPFTIEGPFGKCRYRSQTGKEPILMIGSGTGLAPLYGIATDALVKGHTGKITLFHGAATSSRLYFREELSTLGTAFPNFEYVGCADEDVWERDRMGSPVGLALEQHPNLEGYHVYLCGHPNLVRTAQKKCFLAGASLKDIAADPFVPA